MFVVVLTSCSLQTVDIDVITRETTVQGQNLHETDAGYDPVIRQILDRSGQ